MVNKVSALVAAAIIGAQTVAAVAVYGQCGGQGWTGSTVCDAGSSCVVSNAYYSQCLPNSAASTSTKAGTSTTGSSPQPSATTAPPAGDNPFTGYEIYLSPFYASEVKAAVANLSGTAATKAAKVASIPTFTWFDVASKVPTLGTYLKDAQSLQKSSGKKYIVEIVIYDLPDRDCAAFASNGEYSIADGGAAKYQAYINAIAAQISAYPDVRVVAVYEPDSLANLVTNLSVQKCANAADTYKSLTVYAWQKLTMSNLFLYIDAGHAGWLGWAANLSPAAQLFSQLYTQAGKPARVRGLATNVANYNAVSAATPDPITQGNANYDELHYINALTPLLTSSGFPAHFIIDTARNGVQNIRSAWGDWCNVNGAGFGTRPSTNTAATAIDAYVWVKPGGECDGTSDTSAVRYDSHCGLSDALKPAPEAGTWFQAYFAMLVQNANPSL